MESTLAPRPRPRPAHTQGTTRCAYTPDGARLVTVGSNNTIRLYATGSDGEPANIDDCQEQNIAVATSKSSFVVGSEDGTVSLFSLASASFDRFLLRTSLPIRDVALAEGGKWCAVTSDELTVKIVNTQDISQVLHLREHGRPARHVAFDPKSSLVTLSGTDGIIYVYSLTSKEPELIHKIDGVIAALESDTTACSKVVWHPDGRAFAVPTPTRDIQIISKSDWEKQRCFQSGHLGDITALAWSPNGAMLASAGKDGKILIWETKTQSVLQRYDYSNVIDLCWHPRKNIISFTTTDGEVYIYVDFLSEQFAPLLKLSLQSSPFISDPLSEITGNRQAPTLHERKIPELPTRRRASVSSLGSFFGDGHEGDNDFVEDDDGAGYAPGLLKRSREDEYGEANYANKRRHMPEPTYHPSFQPGSTPWRGNRKYLCLNLIGFVWTINQDPHHTVTVEFYDHEFQRTFHFTDTFLYDKACLNEHGTLFSCPPKEDQPAFVYYRPHETWTQRLDWRIELPRRETVTAMSLSDSFITVITDANYVRVYTLFGMPHRVYRPKSTPMVTCASWKDYVITVGNGPIGPDGTARLLYTIENVKRDEICQNEDTVALPPGETLKSVFFSDHGEPCIYDSTGTLLTLLHWRRPSRACWVPLLDTRLLPRLASGRKNESYFPIAVADDRFHCIILKGGDEYPYFPRPLLSEFDFSIPLSTPPEDKEEGTETTTKKKKKKKQAGEDGEGVGSDLGAEQEDEDEDEEMGEGEGEKEEQTETRRLEQAYLLGGVRAAQVRDAADAGGGHGHGQRSQLSRLELELDKTLLQLLAVECREGEERGMRALELVGLMRDRTGRMMEAAGKVAERYGRTTLGEKIREVGERRAMGEEEGEEE